MNLPKVPAILALAASFTNCSGPGLEEKGFRVDPLSEQYGAEQPNGLSRDSLRFDTRPSNVLLTGISHIRLTTVYKVNHRRDDSSTFIGSNNFHYRYDEDEGGCGNNWHGHLMPGMEAVYGYNFVNISHYDVNTGQQKLLYERPVLIKTLYYPSFASDTLNSLPVSRSHFIVTLFDEDTNKDGYVNPRDLRRIHLFDVNGQRLKAPIPENYSVFSSEYDPANDRMYVFAKLDANNNGRPDDGEPVHIHWIDLKDPTRSGRLY
ncbi:MAG: hypothetical protein KF797_11370 [Flavobacteriales bacterium]|nr:hypothetical protein [Flavobacteriales bacterium]